MSIGKGLTSSWNELKNGERCFCGFLQLDIAKSSFLKGTEETIQKTKENFHDFINRILANYGALKLRWEGDGGAFIFLIKDQMDYDNVVIAAIHILSDMQFFNGMKAILNLLDQDIIVKISCHVGNVNFHREPGKIHGKELNWFLKHEKEIMTHEDAIIITEDIYSKLLSPTLNRAFEPAHCCNSKRLYKSKQWIKWFPKDDNFLDLAVSIRKIAASNTPAGRILLTFATESLRGLQTNIIDLCSDKGLIADKATLIELTKYCFKNAICRYDGTDSHAPSEFLKAYPGYLDFHAENIKMCGISGSRILIVHDDELRRDKDKNYEDYMDFLRWHDEQNKVSLKKIDPLIASDLRQKYELPTYEFGIWYDHYVLLFKPVDGDKTQLWLIFPENKLYTKCINFFKVLNENAREFTAELFDVSLAENWEGFAWPEKRWSTEKSFLLKVLNPYRNGIILDAGAGIGIEYVYLRKEGYNCFANEIEPALRKVGGDFARKHNVSWNPYDFAWEHFGDHFKSEWDVILVLGNSLCLNLDKKIRESCVKNFYEALKPGGMLVIDQRNFDYIWKNKKKIEENPIENFRYKEKVVYCQRSIQGIPYIFGKDGTVTFIYFPKGIKNVKEAYDKRVGQLTMHPFKKTELQDLLVKCKFEGIKVYSDYEFEREGYSEDADFFVFTAFRRKE